MHECFPDQVEPSPVAVHRPLSDEGVPRFACVFSPLLGDDSLMSRFLNSTAGTATFHRTVAPSDSFNCRLRKDTAWRCSALHLWNTWWSRLPISVKLEDGVSVYRASVCSGVKGISNAYLLPKGPLENRRRRCTAYLHYAKDNLGTFAISFDREIRSSRSPIILIFGAAPRRASENPTKSPFSATCVHHVNILSYLQDYSSNISA